MAIIDSNGYLNGERIGRCSEDAQLHFPRLIAASNSFGRIKLNYESILATAYASFQRKNRPTWKEMDRWITEFADNWLLFIYTSPSGETWGQWLIPDHLLARQRYHTAADRRSPAPPKDGLEAYRRAYVDSLKSKSFGIRNIFKPHQTTPNHPDSDAVVNEVVVDVVVEDEEIQLQKTFAQTGEKPPVVSHPPPAEEIYREYPRRVGKRKALEAITKASKRLQGGEQGASMRLPDAYDVLKRAVIAYARSPAGNAGGFTPHPATWFNQSRYLDDPETWEQAYAAREGNRRQTISERNLEAAEAALRRRDVAGWNADAAGDCAPGDSRPE